MKKLFLTTIALLTGIATFAQGEDLTKFVNPRIGTGGHGHVFLGANVPFGYIQLGPTQPTRGWDWCSGYHHSDSVLIGSAISTSVARASATSATLPCCPFLKFA